MTSQFSTTELKLLKLAAQWLGTRQLSDLSDEVLCELTRERGIDFATAALFVAVQLSDGQKQFTHRMGEYSQKPLTMRRNVDAALAIVPGAFYREHPETGADGKKLVDMAIEFGCRAHTIPTQSVGSAAANGQIICGWLNQSNEEKIILCSLSKGGADVKMALADPGAEVAFRKVAAWINVGGITTGSPMATWILARPILSRIYHALFWYRGQDFRFVRDIARRVGSPLDFEVVTPPHVNVIHLLGFPLTSHLQRRPIASLASSAGRDTARMTAPRFSPTPVAFRGSFFLCGAKIITSTRDIRRNCCSRRFCDS